MPFPRPTLQQLQAQAAADISSALPGADPLLRFSNLGILGTVLANMANGHYGFLDWIALQAVPFTATGEYLEGWAALKGVTRGQAVAATGTVQFMGVNGTDCPTGTPITRGDGMGYVTTADETVSGGVVSVPVVCSTPGSAGTLVTGQLMTLASAIGAIQSNGVVSAALTPGVDVQTDDSLRSEMLQVYASPPQGGAASDYVTWALQVPGVTRAWWGGQNGAAAGGPAGTVIVYFMMDVAEAAFGGFPQGTNGVATGETRDTAATGDQLTVANWIHPLQPVTALVYGFAPGNNPVALTIAGTTGWTSAMKTAVEAAIAAVYLQYSTPAGVLDLSYIEAAIGSVAGTAGFVLTVVSCPNGTVSPGSDGNVTASAGYLSTPGTNTWAA
jgi:uncharacterized phage protein gp47/JayE